MSARGMLTVVGTAVGGLIGWSDAPAPSADPASLRSLLEDLGLPPGACDEDLGNAVRLFQSRVTTVYAWVYCHDRTGSTAEVVPAAVGADGNVSIPTDADLTADLTRIFPPDVRQAATDQPQQTRDLFDGLPSDPPSK